MNLDENKASFFSDESFISEKRKEAREQALLRKKQKVWVRVSAGSTHGGQLVLGILWASKWEGGCL